MSIPPGSLVTEIDFLDPACFTNGGTSVTDLSGNSNDWTLNNTSYTYNAALGTLDLGTTSVMTGDNQTPVGTGDVPFTISVWHYATGKRDTIIYNGNYPASGLNLQTIFSSSNTKYVLAYGAGLAFTLESANTYINSWNFITFSYDGTTLKLYVNGSVVDSVATTLSQGVSGSYPNWSVNGENTGVEGFGLLNIYDAALTNGDILALYNSTKTRFLVPVSYYDPQDTASFNNTTAFNDLNGGTDFVFNSTPTYDSTYGAISFDGSNFAVLSNYLTNTWPTGTAAFTMSFWWKTAPNNPNKFAYLFFYGNGPNYIVPFSNYGTEGSVAVLDNASHAVRTTNAFSEDVWYHFAFVKPAGGTFLDFTVYVNGIDQGALTDIVGGSATFSMAVTNNNSIRIQENNPGFISGGSLAQVWVYDQEVDGTDILQQYNSTKSRYDNLVVSYDFSDPLCYPGTGSTIFDLSGSNLDLPISGATFAGTGQSKYFSFDGSDYIGAKNLNLLPSDNTFSMNIWARKNGISSGVDAFLLSIGANPGPSGTNPYITANETAEEYTVQFSNGIGYVVSSEQVPNSVWSMITYTADGTNSKIYIDGVLTGTASQGIGSNPASNATLYIGAVTDGSNDPLVTSRFTGDVAIVDIYNTTLSAGDITTIYNNESSRFGITPTPAYQGIVGGRQFAQGFNG